MIQVQLPSVNTDSLQVQVSLPESFERWRDLYLHDAGEKLVVFLALALIFYLLARLGRRLVGENIEDVNRRHGLRKAIGYGYALLLFLVAIALFADWLTGLGAVLALLLAGTAVALQDVLKSLVGWMYISSRTGIDIGSRVEVNGVTGDVIDIGVLKTTLLEVGGPLVYGLQSTGRLVTVPNYRLLSDTVLATAAVSPFVWHEMRITLTFESDWCRAEEILQEIGREIHAEIEPDLEAGFRRLERRYAFKYGKLTPIIYVSLGSYGIELTLRFLIHVRRRRGAVDLASRRVLAAFAREPNVRLAYPTHRVAGLNGSASGYPGAAELFSQVDGSAAELREMEERR